MIFHDEKGRLTVAPGPLASTLPGTVFRKVEPTGGPEDEVIVKGVVNVGTLDSGPVLELVIACTEFGAIPADERWDGEAVQSIGVHEFLDEYVPVTGAELAVSRLKAVLG